MSGTIMMIARRSARSMIPACTGRSSPVPMPAPPISPGSGPFARRPRRGAPRGPGVRKSSRCPEPPWFDSQSRAPVEELDVVLLYGKLLGLAGFYPKIHRGRDVDDHLLVGEGVAHDPVQQPVRPQVFHPENHEPQLHQRLAGVIHGNREEFLGAGPRHVVLPLQEIPRGRPEESCHEGIGRLAVDFLGGPDLANLSPLYLA